MPKDVIVVVNIDAKPKASEALDILLISTAGAVPVATYRDLNEVKAAFPDVNGEPQRIYNKCAAMFDQGKTTLADTLIRKVKIVGFPALVGDTEDEMAADLIGKIETLQEIDNDWYIFLTDREEDGIIKSLAKWTEDSEPNEAELGAGIEDHRKMYFAQTSNRYLSGAYRRSVIIYTDEENLGEEADAAYLGNVGPFYPTSVTWKFKTPDGITLPDLTVAQRDALEDANINFLTEEYKRQYVKNGTCWDGEFIDVQMGADYIAYYMRETLYDIFQNNAKIPYTDEGFAIIAAGVFATLNRAVDLGIIARDPESEAGVYNVTVPKRAEATDDQARSRAMPDIVWEALLEGAVHSIKVTGTLRASLSA